MKKDRRISQIIDVSTPALTSGMETVDSILEKYPQYAPELRPRLEAVLWLTDAKKNLEPPQGFIISSRACMEIQLEAIQPQGFWYRLLKRYTPQRWVFNVAAPIVLVLLLALIINSLVLTARLSIPGESLYSTKILLENLQLALTFDQAKKTDLYIQYSRERTTEFVELVLEGDYEVLPTAAARSESEIIAYLHSINKLKNQNLTEELPKKAELKETLSNEIYILNILKGSSPPTAYPGIELAIQAAQSGLFALH